MSCQKHNNQGKAGNRPFQEAISLHSTKKMDRIIRISGQCDGLHGNVGRTGHGKNWRASTWGPLVLVRLWLLDMHRISDPTKYEIEEEVEGQFVATLHVEYWCVYLSVCSAFPCPQLQFTMFSLCCPCAALKRNPKTGDQKPHCTGLGSVR